MALAIMILLSVITQIPTSIIFVIKDIVTSFMFASVVK